MRPALKSKDILSIKLDVRNVLQSEFAQMKATGTFKQERIITSPQSMKIKADNKEVLNFCANNYLGLSNNPKVIVFQ